MFLYYSLVLLSPCILHVLAGPMCEGKCCKDKKPLSCIYDTTPYTEQKPDDCSCIPPAPNTDVKYLCEWSKDNEKPSETGFGKFLPCYGFYDHSCDGTKGGIRCFNGYPPPSSIYQSTNNYCNLNAKPEQVYNTFFTCWLYDCENRLKKPETTIQKGGMKWCYPPMVKKWDLKVKLQYCPLYTINVNDTETYFDVGNPKEPSGAKKLCILPPLCGANGKVDTDNYMPTDYTSDEKADRKGSLEYCERPCRKDGNNNGTEDGLPCRVIPSCKSKNSTDGGTNALDPVYNMFQMTECSPWCTVEDSYVRSSSRGLRINQYPGSEDKRCNPLPFCVDGKAPKPLYGPSNPYASLVCIPSRECAVPETPETHICTEKTEDTVGMEIEDGLSTMVIVGIVVSIVLLVVLIGIVITIVLCFRQKKANMPIVDQTGPPPPAFTDGQKITDETVSKIANKPTEKKSATNVKSETKRSLKSLKNVNQSNKGNESAKDASSKKKE